MKKIKKLKLIKKKKGIKIDIKEKEEKNIINIYIKI